jgi:hypothetical protein
MKFQERSSGIESIDLNRLLEVSTAQIRSILEEGNKSIDDLTNEFKSIGKSLEEINISAAKNGADIHMDEILSSVNKTLILFQFYDRLTQRLQHVIDGVDIISKGIESRGCAGDWDDLYQEICDNYTLSEEQTVFERMMGKKNSAFEKNISKKQNVELF